MNKLFCVGMVFVLFVFILVFFVDFIFDFGMIGLIQIFMLVVFFLMDFDLMFEFIDINDQVVVSGLIQVVYIGVGFENYDYVILVMVYIFGVMIGYSGYWNIDLDIFGLFIGNY